MPEEFDLFEDDIPKGKKAAPKLQPLADRMRPETLDDFVGQEHIVGEGKFLSDAIGNDNVSSIIFWGPPGSGKTTLARIISNSTDADFVAFSAVTSGVKEIREVINRARRGKRKTILFIDEIHRFNKAQQDAFLPHVEDGTIILIGATTENPSFEVNSPLLSRSRVLVLDALTDQHIREIAEHTIGDREKGIGEIVSGIDDEALNALVSFSSGDARKALNTLELAAAGFTGKKKRAAKLPPPTSKKHLRRKCSDMTVPEKSTIILFPPYIKVCGVQIPTQRSTGSAV